MSRGLALLAALCCTVAACSFVAICACYGALKSSFCGCAGGECRGYEQQ